MKIQRYDESYKTLWDDFVRTSKNGVFLFYRDYMEYHADRYKDFSLLFFDGRNKLKAVLPASVAGETVISHGGLTFGGVVSGVKMKMSAMLEIFDSLSRFLRENGVRRLIYKAVPHIYHMMPAEEDLYALFLLGARLVRRDVSSAIARDPRIAFNRDRQRGIRQGKEAGLEIGRDLDFAGFMTLAQEALTEKYRLRPAHTPEEMAMLAGRFPDHIKLFTARKERVLTGGVIVYESSQVAHAQYKFANSEGRECGAADLVLDYLIHDYYREKPYFDFGISTEQDGRYLNAGLIENKERYGARSIVYDFYEWNIMEEPK
ncbi:MAG: GNAT family N-acetyltransferase [Candidatus Aminicenantales bacterium]